MTTTNPRRSSMTPAAWVYLGLAIAGLAGTMYFNITGFTTPSLDFFGAWFANPAVSSLSIDLLVTASAASVFIVLEGRELKIRLWWLYIAASFVTAVAFTFPLFLMARERKRAQLAAAN